MSRRRCLFLAACAIAASPALAEDPAPVLAPPGQAPAPAPLVAADDSGVERFYATHSQAPIWFRDAATRQAAAMLPAILRRAAIDGLAEGPELAAGAEVALASGQLADDKILSAAWVRYVETLTAPVDGMSYGDPALAPSAGSAASMLARAAAAAS